MLAGPLRRYTDATVTTPDRLRRTLVDIRRHGYAYCPGHIHEEALGVAVPVTGGDRRVVAALSVIVPNDEAGRSVIPVLLTAARGITRILSR